MVVSPAAAKADSPRDRRRYAQRFSTGLTPATLASIFSAADQGDLSSLMELEQELLKDEQIGGYLDTRLGSLSQRDLCAHPAKSDPDPERAADVAAFNREILSALRFWSPSGSSYSDEGGLPEIVEAVDGASYFGMALPWIHWDTRLGDSLPRPVAVELLDQRRYRTKPETNEVLLEAEGSYWGTPITQYDPWCLIPAYGRSLAPRKEFAGCGRAVAFAWHLRTQGRLYTLGYAERFSIPAVVGTFESFDPEAIKAAYSEEELAKLQRFVESFMSDAAGIFPPGFKVTVVGASQGGEALFKYIEECSQRAISTAILGQDGTSSGQGGSYAKASVNEISRQDLIRKGGRRVCSWFTRLLGYATELHFGEGTPPADLSFALTPDEQAVADRERLKIAKELELPISLDFALSALGLQEPADGAVLLDGTVWDGEQHRRKPRALSGKDLAQAMSAGIYPLVSGLNGGIGIDVPAVAAALGLPLDPALPPYTPPAQAGQDGAQSARAAALGQLVLAILEQKR